MKRLDDVAGTMDRADVPTLSRRCWPDLLAVDGRRRPSGSRATGRIAGPQRRRPWPVRDRPSRHRRGCRPSWGRSLDLDRRWRAEAHHLVDDVGRLERQPELRDPCRRHCRPARPRASTSRRSTSGDARAACRGDGLSSPRSRTVPGLSATRITDFLRAADPEVDGVDRIARTEPRRRSRA